MLDRLGLDCVEMRNTDISIVSATNNEVVMIGEVIVSISIGDSAKLSKFPFLVTENLTFDDADCIIGMNFLEGFGAQWDFSRGIIQIGSMFVDTKTGFVTKGILKRREDHPEVREEDDRDDEELIHRNSHTDETIDDCMMHVRLTKKLPIWPRSEAFATCEIVPTATDGDVYVIEPYSEGRFTVESSIVRIIEGKFRLPIQNLGNAPLILNAGTRVAYAHDTDDAYVMQAADLPDVGRESSPKRRRTYLKKMNELKKKRRKPLKK